MQNEESRQTITEREREGKEGEGKLGKSKKRREKGKEEGQWRRERDGLIMRKRERERSERLEEVTRLHASRTGPALGPPKIPTVSARGEVLLACYATLCEQH